MLFVFYFCSYFKNKTIEWRITDREFKSLVRGGTSENVAGII